MGYVQSEFKNFFFLEKNSLGLVGPESLKDVIFKDLKDVVLKVLDLHLSLPGLSHLFPKLPVSFDSTRPSRAVKEVQ